MNILVTGGAGYIGFHTVPRTGSCRRTDASGFR